MTSCAENPSNSSGSSSQSSPDTQVDYLCEDNDYGYYLKEDSLGKHIYRQNKISKENTLLKSEQDLHRLVLSNDWLYYDSAGEQNICRIKTNGEDFSVILNYKSLQEDEEDSTTGLWVVDNKLLVRMAFPLYCYDIESGKTINVSWDARSNVQVVGNKVYFCGKDFSISEMDIQTGEIQVILQGDIRDKEESKNLYKNFIFVGDIMYYYKRNPDGLYRYQNSESTLVYDNSDVNEFSLFEYDGKLYFIVRNGETIKLIQYNPIDEKVTEVLTCNDFRSGPKIKDGYFYYQDSEDNIKRIKIP